MRIKGDKAGRMPGTFLYYFKTDKMVQGPLNLRKMSKQPVCTQQVIFFL